MAPVENDENIARREQYTAKFKLRVIALAEKVGNRCAGRRYAVAERNIRRWRLDKHRLQQCHSDQLSFRGPKAGRLSFIETELAAFVVASRKKGVKVTWSMIATKARVLATAYGVSQDKFCASRGWMNRFMTRQGLTEAGTKSLLTPRYPVFSKHRTEKFSLSQIGIGCQVALYFDKPADFLNVDDRNCYYDSSRVRHVTDDNDVLHDWVQTVWLSQCGPQSMRRSVLIVDSSSPMADPRMFRGLYVTSNDDRKLPYPGYPGPVRDSISTECVVVLKCGNTPESEPLTGTAAETRSVRAGGI
ncbi:hypothetical protein HPB50_015691 [Hyalomma asiaticum]|uniref:Uncharacterized protein n=1 Tax=Hyalomma asiaticum TaxID=266040 RepID=A0ACB7SZ60_HYAAI|nr:hypothetical protein HPB50_015691 [Hyalomma asiaticum]